MSMRELGGVKASRAGKYRDLRIDFFRGVALIGIAINHTVPPVGIYRDYGHYQFGHFFSFNFADVFVFLSGTTCAFAYGRLMNQEGYLAAQRKAVGRVVQLYVVYWTALLLTIPILASLRWLGGDYEVHSKLALDPESLLTAKGVLGALAMDPPVAYFDILQFYAILILLMPIALWLYQRSRLVAWGLTLGLYLYVNAADRLGWPGVEQTAGPFGNYLAWQLLFFGGMFLGIERQTEAGRDRLARLQRPGLVAVVVAFLIVTDYARQMTFAHFHFDDKELLGPLRIVELLAVAVVIGFFIRHDTPALLQGLLGWVTRTGRQSLLVFAVTIILALTLTHLMAMVDAGRGEYLAAIVLAAVLTATTGRLVDGWMVDRRMKARKVTVLMPLSAEPKAAVSGT